MRSRVSAVSVPWLGSWSWPARRQRRRAHRPASPRAEPSPISVGGPRAARATVLADPLVRPVIDGAFDVGDGRKLYLQCWGEGSPTIVIDAGGGEIQEYRDYAATFTSRLAEQRRVCAYDRAGHGRSDPAPTSRASSRTSGETSTRARGCRCRRAPRPRRQLVWRFHHGVLREPLRRGRGERRPPRCAGAERDDDGGGRTRARLGPSGQRRAQRRRRRFREPPRERAVPVRGAAPRGHGSTGRSSVDDQAFWLDWSPSSRQIELRAGTSSMSTRPWRRPTPSCRWPSSRGPISAGGKESGTGTPAGFP